MCSTYRAELEAATRKAEEDQKRNAEEKLKIKANLKKNRQRLRQLCAKCVEEGETEQEEVQRICLEYSGEQLEELSNRISGMLATEESSRLIGKLVLETLDSIDAENRAEEERKKLQRDDSRVSHMNRINASFLSARI